MESNGKQESFELVHLLYITLILFVLCTDYHFIDENRKDVGIG